MSPRLKTDGLQWRCLLLGMVTVLGGARVVQGVPALSDPFVLKQPDGRAFTARAGGDEFFNWVSHQDRLIVKDQAGQWRYARVRADDLTPSAARVGLDLVPADTATGRDAPALAARVAQPIATRARGRIMTTTPTTRPLLVILVEFRDQAISTTDAYWHNLFFQAAGKTARTYFSEISGGLVTLVPATEYAGTVSDGIVRVQLTASDHNSGNHPNPGTTMDDRNRWITHDALWRADPQVPFNVFDTDYNYALTPAELHIVIVVAGFEASVDPGAFSPAVWAHRWALGFTNDQWVPAPQCDSIQLCGLEPGNPARDSGYVQVGEWHADHPATIGVVCHELGHDNDLPDLYDTTFASSGIGAHGLMGAGGWGAAAEDLNAGESPVHPCAWSKVELGYASPIVATVNSDVTLQAAGSAAYNILRVNTSEANQYFLLENRQLQGFDAGLDRWFSVASGGAAGGGLAVWHIDESVDNNDNPVHKMVDLEEAAAATLDSSLPNPPTDPRPWEGNRAHYFYAGHVGDFGETTTPDSRLYNNAITNINVSAISLSGMWMKSFVAKDLRAQLDWSTYLGAAGEEKAYGLALDNSENLYLTGPTSPGTRNSFVTKLDSNGAQVWSATIGDGIAYGIDVDAAGAAYVTGHALEFFAARPNPSFGDSPPYAYDYTYNGGQGLRGDAFVAKLAPNGSTHPADGAWATFVGGTYHGYHPYWSGADRGHGIAVNAAGEPVITGMTDSKDFPETEGSVHGHDWDGFVTKLNAAGTGLIYSRYLCDPDWGLTFPVIDEGFDVAYDLSGNAWVIGYSDGDAFAPVVDWPWGFDTTFDYHDAFLVKIDADGDVIGASYLGGNEMEYGYALAVDTAGNPFAAGYTHSNQTSFPLVGAFDAINYWQTGDAFITCVNTACNSVTYSTFYGGFQKEYAHAIDVDSENNMLLVGLTESDDLQVSGGALATTRAGGTDAFVAKLKADGTTLELGTYLGGTGIDEARGVAAGPSGAIYVAGFTNSADFPTTTNGQQPVHGGGNDAFAAKLTLHQHTDSLVVGAPDGGGTWCLGRTDSIQWSSSGAGTAVSIELSRDGPAGPWEMLFAATSNDNGEDWTASGLESTDCYLRITDLGAVRLMDMSNTAFAIADCAAGDFDGDGDVDVTDYNVFADCLDASAATSEQQCIDAFDFDGDNDIDLSDFANLQEGFTG